MRGGLYIAALGLALVAAAPTSTPKLGYLYNLSDTAGPIREEAGDVAYDRRTSEIFVVGFGVVRVFNQTGMETFSFRVDPALGTATSAAPLDSGDLLILARRTGTSVLTRCNFRGELCVDVPLVGVPAEWAGGFNPNALRRAGDLLYVADTNSMRVVAAAPDGAVRRSYDLARAIEAEQDRADLGLSGFDVARDGSLLFTISPLFKAYQLRPDGTVRSWGTPGGAPGRFNVVKGVVADDRGRLYVLDALKSAVIAFDENLTFVGEFGYRGNRPGNLVSPASIAFGDDRIFVAQNGGHGVAVFRIHEK